MALGQRVLSTLFGVLWLLQLAAQPYEPGQTYFGTQSFTEYLAGNLPMIIVAPHGGLLSPAQIPDRSCSGCVYVNDANTQDLARRLAEAIFVQTGCRPHLIINHLHRRKMDANRDLAEAADGNALAGQAWEDFHDFISAAKASVTNDYGKGLLIDLHGHAHAIQRLEWGYLLYEDELALPDPVLNSEEYLGYSSIRQLALANLSASLHAALLRGPLSLGQLVYDRGYPGVPSATQPAPAAGDPYFSGGYNTNRHGSRFGGAIDAVQLECNMEGVRDNPGNRQAFADVLAHALTEFFQRHYFSSFGTGFCQLSAAEAPDIFRHHFTIAPNPCSGQLQLIYEGQVSKEVIVTFFTVDGRRLASYPLPASSSPIAVPQPGPLWVCLQLGSQLLHKELVFCR